MLLNVPSDRCCESGTGPTGGDCHSKRAASDNRAGIEIAPFRIVHNVNPDIRFFTLGSHGGIDRLVVGSRERNSCPCEVALTVAPPVQGYTPLRRQRFDLFAGLLRHNGHGCSRFNEVSRFPGSDDAAADDYAMFAFKRQEYR